MADMTVTEFAEKFVNDKDYMLEVVAAVPDEMIEEASAKGEGEPEAGDNPEKDSVPFIGYIVAASEVMGYNFGFDELDAAIDAAMDKHNALYKIRFGWRLIKAFAAKGEKA